MTAPDGGADPADRLRATLDSLLDPHVVLTAVRDGAGEIVDFEYTDANAAACAYNGLSYDELIGVRLLDFLPNHASSGLLDQYRKVIDSGEPLVLDDFVYPLELRGNEEVHFDIRGVALGDSIVYSWRDVTERHEQIRAIREAEREYRSLAESTTDMAYRTDADRRIVWVSPSVTRVLGYEPEEMLGKTIRPFVDPAEFASHEAQWSSAYTGEWEPDGEQDRVFHVLKKGGGAVPMTTVVSRDLDLDGRWTGGLLIGLRDVTDLLREQDLAERERKKAERLQLSMDRAAVGMAITSLDGVFEYVNPAMATMLGHRQEDFVGMTFRDITHAEDADASEAMLGRLLSNEVDSLSMRKRYITATGATIWADIAVGVARREDGQLDHFVAQLIDVTAEVEYADALETTVRRFRQLAENASDVVYEMDTDWTIRWISPSVQNVLGWDPEFLVGTGAPDIIAPGQERLIAMRGEQIRAGYSVSGETLAYRTASGQIRWMSAMAHPMVDEQDVVSGVIVGLRDVTAEVEAREALSKVQQRLRLAVDAAPDGMVITDENGILMDVNRQFCRLIEMPERELVGRSMHFVLDAAGGGSCEDAQPHEHPLPSGDDVRWIEHDVWEVPAEQQSGGYLVHLFSDVTREHLVRQELTHLATHDVLTGVANRRWFIERFQRLARTDEVSRAGIGVLFCDVDRLKEINDVHGHLAGDAVLTAVANRLADAVRGSDDVGRMGGDEFVVLLDGLTSVTDLAAVAGKIRERVEGSVLFEGRPIALSASIGATLMVPGEEPRAALKRADAALLQAKAQGRNRVVVHDL